MTKSEVRVRYAPSPTGYLHVGGARSLLFNYLYARKHGGTLVLRIEDTDQARSTREFEKMVLDDIELLNLAGDESPRKGGPHAPYRQSERLSTYADHARQLLERDQAYYCFCKDEDLEKKRELAMKLGRPPHYDGTCARTPLSEARARLAKGERAGIRFRALQKDYVLKDQVKGDVTFGVGVVGDFFITRTPRENEKEIGEGIGMPVYNFCCVIDDHLMNMTHVIRGDDHLSNTARQLMIYDAFNWDLPVFAHIAMVLGADRQKLSKRNGDTSVHDYFSNGYLPEALLNFLALLGWNPGANITPVSGHPEIFTMEEMIQFFGMDGLQKAPAVFDVQKLRWMNGQYIRSLPLDDIAKRARTFFKDLEEAITKRGEAWYQQVVEVVRGECHLLSEIPQAAALFFESAPAPEEAALQLLKDPGLKPVLQALRDELAALPEVITAELVDTFQKSVGTKSGAKGKGLFMPIRAAITGKTHGPEMKKVMPLLGKSGVHERLTAVLAAAGV